MRHHRVRFLLLVSLALAAAGAVSAGPAVFKIKVTAEIANVRVKPFIGSNIVRQFPEGTVLEAERKEGEWFLVKIEPDEAGATEGYVHESLVLALEEIPAEAKAPVAETEKTAVTENPPAAPPAIGQTPPKEAKKEETTAEKPPVYEATKEILAEAEDEKETYISLWGGGGLTAGGDLNRGAEGLAAFYAAQLNQTADRDVSPAQIGYQFGGEAGFRIARGVKIAVGVEYGKTARETTLLYSGDEETVPSLKVKPEFEILPVHISLVCYPTRFLYLRAGVDYFFARAKYHYAFSAGDTIRDWQGTATSGGAGLCAGVGLDLPIGRGFYVTAEVDGRYAKISGFSGSNSYLDESLTEAYVEKGRLYAYEARTSNRTSYTLVFVRDKTPAESGVENATDAVLDLSGISLRLGVKIKF